jgi:putative salt-induced outer membrane protein
MLWAADSPDSVAAGAAESTATPAAEKKSEWKGEGALGYTAASGNTESDSLNAKLGLSKERARWKHSVSVESLKATTDSVTSADRFVFREKTEYRYGEKAYVFGKLRYEDDEFSGFDYQSSIAFGVGSRFIDTEIHLLDASVGIGYRKTKDTLTQLIEEQGIVTADAKYVYKISASASFSEQLSVESGSDNTYSESETVLKTKINGNLASQISYLVKHNSDVPVATENTDKILTVSLVYSF